MAGQGEDVLKMDQIANEIVKHYVGNSGRIVHAVSEEEKDIIPMNLESGRYFFYYDPLDGSSNVPTTYPSVSSSASLKGTSMVPKTCTSEQAMSTSPPACS
jgi:fructose-1,6-bisphosphatase